MSSLFPDSTNDSKTAEKIRQDWIDACNFHPLEDHQVLAQVVQWTRETNPNPTVLLDLDSTLYEVGPRTYRILKEYLAAPASRIVGADARAILDRMEMKQVGYSLHDTFKNIGLDPEAASLKDVLKDAKKFWGARFFTDEYLAHDHAYDGAPEFVQELHGMGAEIIYLTGRDEPGMGKGTRARLLQDRFPWERERTHLLLKRSHELDDLDHKLKAADYVKRTGALVASFENEPPNVVALSEIFPAAMHVFMDSVYSDKPALPKKGLYRIRSFRRA